MEKAKETLKSKAEPNPEEPKEEANTPTDTDGGETTKEVGEAIGDGRFALDALFGDNTTLKVIVVMAVAFLVAYFLGKIVAKVILKLTQLIAVQADESSSEERFLKLRRIETYLSVSLVLLRTIIFVVVILLAIALLFDGAFRGATAIGASTIFFVLGVATIGVLLRDLTAGSTMIIEKWFSVGDFIRVEPFLNTKGVVEKMTLRATKIRDISGEVTWMHNQYMQAVSVTPGGKRSQAIDIFVDNLERAQEQVETVIKTLRPGPTMLASPLHIVETEKISDKVWRLTIVGETAPGREWLVEDFFAKALVDANKRDKHFNILYGPLVRYADDAAERRFRRAVRIRNQ